MARARRSAARPFLERGAEAAQVRHQDVSGRKFRQARRLEAAFFNSQTGSA